MNDQPAEEPLKRDIGFLGSAFLSFNGLVGAGIFVLPGTLFDRFGGFSPLLFPLFGLLFLVIAVPFARVTAHHAKSGGPVAYAAPFGPFVSFQAGWLYYVARVAALAANATVFATYLASFWPWIGSGPGRASAIVAMVAVTSWINVIGVRRAIRWLDLLTLLKAAPLLLLALAALASRPPSVAIVSPALSELEAAALLILYAFVGFENSVVSAGETREPRRTIPRALVTTVIATAALYTLVQLAYATWMAPGAGGEAPLVALAGRVAGPAGAAILTATVVFSLMGNISGGITSATRVTYALGRDGLAPAWFARVGRHATPVNSILFMGLLTTLLALSGSFVWLAVVSTLARMFVYGLAIASLPKLEGFRPPILALAGAGLAVCAWAAAQSSAQSWLTLLALTGSGIVLFLIRRR
ncbi:APC family permease [Sphingomonas sp. ID1715]|uniref:APC family permease n=1 Tax=Sphingomonas sp. ID1715 TaxID=1656898 RepID=UPI001488496D|nr:APC family permease [Sphingomonas sp. ID1715]NNM77496.1 APC family permease [Sphingomonas sp. ID1715]